MKRFLIAFVVLAVAGTAFAGGNPSVECYVSFDQSGFFGSRGEDNYGNK